VHPAEQLDSDRSGEGPGAAPVRRGAGAVAVAGDRPTAGGGYALVVDVFDDAAVDAALANRGLRR